ncbi:sigma-70 family RNA polymerase sigma factor [Rhodococcus sp. AG1013]|uniref:sigma-70 family RNA polymerase sigma factor n=1 Tax=unclassified Rhodococcus (in: high G+C Gram-positive bacteria) TaxID=192944 RepID=UPI000E0A6E5C|nr:sigma-70 family RNA polymerase sigma factor [Rhodococcus sp. AG1013]RDI34060.1 RNA polymerase ECF family sigma subunit [Rhodococcus sp. AG1013]
MDATVVLDALERGHVSSAGSSGGDDACPVDNGKLVAARHEESVHLRKLLADIAEGDRAAFADFYDRTGARVYGMVLRVLRDPGFSEETTQEVYLQVWRSAGNFDPERGSPLSWLMTLAHRRAVDRVRSEQSHSDREVVYETANRVDEFDQVTEEVQHRAERQAVLDCLQALTDIQRQSVTLAYYGGRTYREVAAELGVAVPTVKSRIRDGLTRLRGCLGVI